MLSRASPSLAKLSGPFCFLVLTIGHTALGFFFGRKHTALVVYDHWKLPESLIDVWPNVLST